MIEYLANLNEIVSKYKDEIFEYMQELQVRIFSLNSRSLAYLH
jgi:hypothetical protein